MADINADEHSPLLLNGFWELHRKQVTSDLGVDLPEDVCSLREVERSAISASDDLRRHLVLLEDFLESRVVALKAKHCNTDQRVSEDALLVDHVLPELML